MIDPIQAAVDAAFPGLPECMSMEEAERRIRAGIAAYLRACAERDLAEVKP